MTDQATPQRDIERELFEKCPRFAKWDFTPAREESLDDYMNTDTQIAWQGWQARAAQATAEPVKRKYVLSDAERVALAEAAKTGAVVAEMDGGLVMFINRGEDYGDSGRDLNCPACGGSGHVDDAAPDRAPSADSAADKRDAARYRALRDLRTTGMPIVHPPFEPGQGYIRDGLDSAVDAAIAASAPQQKDR